MGKRSKRDKRTDAETRRAASPAAGTSSGRRARHGYLAALAAVLVAILALIFHGLRPPPGVVPQAALPDPMPVPASAAAAFVDETACAGCHAAQHREWQQSHHALAMQEANPKTVLGNFSDAHLATPSGTTRFFRRGDRYLVSTDGPDGTIGEFVVRYVFGYSPLQQYLVELPRGRLQALPVAWDVLQQRWFHLHADERIDHRDELHWTKISQNWNSMCSECHSTEVRKNYDYDRDSYATSFRHISIGCQGCHGPGSRHVAWARDAAAETTGSPGQTRLGLPVDLAAADSRIQIEACARCHSRRSVIAPEYVYGQRLLDSHLPSLIEEPLYHADGQIRDETFEYGSFMQSRMAAKGLRCSDCHDPHSARPKAEGNALCTRCHNPTGADPRPGIDAADLRKKDYDNPSHHLHEPGTPGSRCVDCHAPSTTYMVVDPRADHSFRIPRPDLTEKLGTPNACNGCHRDRSPRWARDVLRRAHPEYQPPPHYGEALAAGRSGRKGAVPLLAALAEDPTQAAIVRASALALLQRYPGAITARLHLQGLQDPDPLVRHTAVSGFLSVPPGQRAQGLGPALSDPVRAVRIEAARLLAASPRETLGPRARRDFDAALAELKAGYRHNLDHAGSRVSYANLYLDLGQTDKAESYYRAAMNVEHVPVVAIVNFADFYRATAREGEAEALLRDGLRRYPDNPELTRALALSLIRQQRKTEALNVLKRGLGASANADLAYLYAVALDDAGELHSALQVLEKALSASRGSRDILVALAAFHAKAGNADEAAAYLKRLAAINPADPALPAGDARPR